MQAVNPLISVIIPVYNGEIYLAKTIESVLAQTYTPFEVILIDDGSTDSSGAIARSFVPQIRYYAQANAGLGSALNKGIELAEGRYFAFLDHDDLWVEHKLTRQMHAFAHNPGLDAVFSHIEQFYSPDLDPEVRKKVRYAQQTMSGFCADTLLISRQAFARVGNFDPLFRAAAFLDWYARAKEQELRIELIPEVLAQRRIHNTNMGIKMKDSVNVEYTRLLKAALDRRRAAKDHNSE
jgi:glycosyltransferase involved in cell wall biosynthesis